MASPHNKEAVGSNVAPIVRELGNEVVEPARKRVCTSHIFINRAGDAVGNLVPRWLLSRKP